MRTSTADRNIIVPTEAFAHAAAERLAQAIRERTAVGLASVALAGGSTPRNVYADLAAHTVFAGLRLEG